MLALSRNEAVGMGDRARPGHSGPRPRGPLEAQETIHRLGLAGRVRVRRGARRTAAGAAAIPIHFHCLVPGEDRLPACSRSLGGQPIAAKPRRSFSASAASTPSC
jgi:hypothetical protein